MAFVQHAYRGSWKASSYIVNAKMPIWMTISIGFPIQRAGDPSSIQMTRRDNRNAIIICYACAFSCFITKRCLFYVRTHDSQFISLSKTRYRTFTRSDKAKEKKYLKMCKFAKFYFVLVISSSVCIGAAKERQQKIVDLLIPFHLRLFGLRTNLWLFCVAHSLWSSLVLYREPKRCFAISQLICHLFLLCLGNLYVSKKSGKILSFIVYIFLSVSVSLFHSQQFSLSFKCF